MTGYQSKRAAAQDKLAQPAQEPVACYHDDFGTLELSRVQRVGWKPLYTTPPKRPWVDLTDEEITKTYWSKKLLKRFTPIGFAREIEQLLKEKNNG